MFIAEKQMKQIDDRDVVEVVVALMAMRSSLVWLPGIFNTNFSGVNI